MVHPPCKTPNAENAAAVNKEYPDMMLYVEGILLLLCIINFFIVKSRIMCCCVVLSFLFFIFLFFVLSVFLTHGICSGQFHRDATYHLFTVRLSINNTQYIMCCHSQPS
jgi:hypothetical protein